MKTLTTSLLALAIAALAGPLTAAPLTLKAQIALQGTSITDLKTADMPMFRRGSDDDGDDDQGNNEDDDGDDDSGHHSSGHDSNDDNSSSDDDSNGSGRDHPRIPGGSGCDDLFDLIEHPECRI